MLPTSFEDIERKPAFTSYHIIPLIPDVISEPSKEDLSNEVDTPSDIPPLNNPVFSPPAISVTPFASPDLPHYHASEPAGNEQATPTRGRGRPRCKRGFKGVCHGEQTQVMDSPHQISSDRKANIRPAALSDHNPCWNATTTQKKYAKLVWGPCMKI